MKKLFGIILAIALLVTPAFAGQQLVNLPLTADLTDTKGNLTAGGLIRNSDATYVNTAGALAYSRGTRTNLVLYSEDTTQANWVGGTVQTFTLAINTTYILSVSKTGAILTLAAGTGAYTVLSGTTATPGSPVAFTMTTGGTVTVTTNTSNPKAQLEALPSGNVIGSDLMDQESLTARAAGYTLVVGAVYKIGTRATLDFTTVGAANNTAGTYFICHTAGDLGAGDVASTVNSPAKGSFHDVAMLAGSTELVVNGGAETDSGWNTWSSPTTNERSNEQAYLGTYSRKCVGNSDGDGIQPSSFTTVVGKLYKVEAWYYISAKTATGIYMNPRQSADPWTATTQVAGTTTGAWTKISAYFIPATTSTGVTFNQNGAGSITFYIDQLSVREVQTDWRRAGTNTVEIDSTEGSGGALKITYVDATGPYVPLRSAGELSSNLTVGETYQVTGKVKVSAGNSVELRIWLVNPGTNLVLKTVTETTLTSFTGYFKASNASDDYILIGGFGAGESIWIDDLTIKSVPDLAYLSPGTYTATAGSTATIPAEPRFETNGLLVEGEATNFVTYSCDFTNAAWVKTNITPLKNQTGPDGVASSASLLTAGAANGTALFTVADGGVAANKTFSLWIKRVTGTGNIDLTDNNGTNWTTQSVTSTWTKFTLAARSQAIPIVGIRIVTSADAVAVCLAQNEISAYSTSGIYTNGCPVTRLTEAGSTTNGYSWTKAAGIDTALGVKGTVLLDFIPGHAAAGGTGTGSGILAFAAAAANVAYYDYTNTNFESADGTNTPENDETIVSGTTYTLAVRWDETADGGGGFLKVSEKHGGAWTHGAATAFDGAFVITGTKAYVGYGNEYPFWIRNVKFFDGWVKDANLNSPKMIQEDIFTRPDGTTSVDELFKVKAYEY